MGACCSSEPLEPLESILSGERSGSSLGGGGSAEFPPSPKSDRLAEFTASATATAAELFGDEPVKPVDPTLEHSSDLFDQVPEFTVGPPPSPPRAVSSPGTSEAGEGLVEQALPAEQGEQETLTAKIMAEISPLGEDFGGPPSPGLKQEMQIFAGAEEKPEIQPSMKEAGAVAEPSLMTPPKESPLFSPQQGREERRKSTMKRPTLGDGAYLVFAPTYDGTFSCVWTKKPLEDALAYAKPKEGVRVPPFKYRGKSEVARGVTRSKQAALEGVLYFLRSVRGFQCSATLIDQEADSFARIPQFILVAHMRDDSVVLVEPNSPFFSLNDSDLCAAVLINTTGETDMKALAQSTQPVPSQVFHDRCKRNAQHLQFINFVERDTA